MQVWKMFSLVSTELKILRKNSFFPFLPFVTSLSWECLSVLLFNLFKILSVFDWLVFDSWPGRNRMNTSCRELCCNWFPSFWHITYLLLFHSLVSSCRVCAGWTVKWSQTPGWKHFICAAGYGCHLSVSTHSNHSERLEWKGNSNTNTLSFVETHLFPRCSTNGYLCPLLSVWTSPPLPPVASLSSTT